MASTTPRVCTDNPGHHARKRRPRAFDHGVPAANGSVRRALGRRGRGRGLTDSHTATIAGEDPPPAQPAVDLGAACPNCSWLHAAVNCPAEFAICYHCASPGHFSRCCTRCNHAHIRTAKYRGADPHTPGGSGGSRGLHAFVCRSIDQKLVHMLCYTGASCNFA